MNANIFFLLCNDGKIRNFITGNTENGLGYELYQSDYFSFQNGSKKI